MTSQLPQETLRQLCDIFPSFAHEWAREHAPAEDGLVDGVYYEWTHHGVLRPFLEYFANNQHMFPEVQIRALGLWINSAVAVDGELENAVSTCFLEHMRQHQPAAVGAPLESSEG
jgi:hypothetical protein